MTLQFCEDELRRNAVAQHANLNGIDAIEVLDATRPPQTPRQQTLLVRCFKPLAQLTRANVTITGGARVKEVKVTWAARADSVRAEDAPAAERQWFNQLPQRESILAIRTDSSGDFSRYTLQLIDAADPQLPAPAFDPKLSSAAFSFKVDCPNPFDCAPVTTCEPEVAGAPDIDYLAKDYSGYRRLITDRLSQLLPDWRDRSPADLGVVLAELLAYAGDQLSYQQDAVATEAYLATARRRVSIRRHARLVDYYLHDGCNARAWLIVDVDLPRVEIARSDIHFITRIPNATEPRFAPEASVVIDALEGGLVEVFEPLNDLVLHSAHATLPFYTWGDRNCCLPRGATRATLSGHFPDLKTGDVLVIEEIVGPRTHEPYDADLAHRHAVRLKSAQATFAGNKLIDPLTGAEITEIVWHAEDALPFPVCVSSVSDADHGQKYSPTVSVARGNVVLVDHGRSMRVNDADESLGTVGRDPRRYRPVLKHLPLTQAAAAPADSAPARTALATPIANAVPVIALRSEPDHRSWICRRDLFDSKATETHFVVETDDDGRAWIRFGDNVNGNRPEAGTAFHARYRVGNGAAGNVGAESIAHAVTGDGAIAGVRNPMPAVGGMDPQPVDEARRRAPYAFRRQDRAVTADDYARRTEEYGGIQRAAARLRWTGSWHTMFVAVDREDGVALDDTFEDQLTAWVDRYRMAGHDLEFDQARLVPLKIEIGICIKPGFRPTEVIGAVTRSLASQFDSDRLTFGQTVYLSPLYSAAHAVPGVESAQILVFERQGQPSTAHMDAGCITFAPLEIPQLDNDPNFPDRGVLRVIDNRQR